MSARGEQLNWPFAALWASGMLAAWLISCSIPTWGSRWIAPLSVLACAAQAATVAIRLPRWKSLPIPRGWTTAYWPATTHSVDDELTWLLAWTSQLHVLAAAVELSGSLWSGLVPLIPCLAAEIWIWPHAPAAWQTSLSRGSHWLNTSALLPQVNTEPDESTSELMRSQSQGLLPDGEIYQSGWAIVNLSDQLKSTTLTIVFSPPFLVPPEVELDHELTATGDQGSANHHELDEADVEVELSVEHITPAGMRIAIKRKPAAGPLEVKLFWHAVDSQVAPVRKLP